MQLRIKSGSLAAGLGLVGTGVPIVFPEVKLVGVVLIVTGVLAFAFDVHLERGQVEVGQGGQSPGSHIQAALRRLTANWLTLVLLIGAVALSPFALHQFQKPASTQVAINSAPAAPLNSPARPNAPGPKSNGEPVPKPPSPAGVTPAPMPKLHPQNMPPSRPPLPAPTGGAAESPPHPRKPNDAPASGQSPDLPKSPAPEPTVTKVNPETQAAQIARVRKHRDDGDELFDSMFAADNDAKVMAAEKKVIAWDREGAEMINDYWGPKRQVYYVTENLQKQSYAEPYYGGLSSTFFFQRIAYLNLIRSRQLSLGALASAAQDPTWVATR